MSSNLVVDEVVGFDLGHGESAVARLALAPNSSPQILSINTKNSQVTAVGTYEGSVIVGEAVLRSLDVTDVHVGFKRRPPGTLESRKATIAFVSKYHEILTSTGQIAGGDRTHYFVGCPSSWRDDEMNAYRELLLLALPKVTVVRESRAALIQAKEEGRITAERLRSSIVVIDLGSSTIDVSYIYGGIRNQSLDIGTELGGHLIEKEILRRALQRSRQRSDLEAFLATNETERRMAELFCRELKERYWSLETVAGKQRRNQPIPVGDQGLTLEPVLNPAEMESILTSPLPELGGASWRHMFLDLLEQIRIRLANRKATVDVLVLTGGPSKMSFVRDLCREQFSSADFVWCTPPEETVALGLARWGRIQLQTNAFSTTVRELCRTTVPAIVESRSDTLRSAVATEIARTAVMDVVAPTVRAWRAGDLDTLEQMDKEIGERMLKWIQSPTCVAAIERAYTPILDSINHEVDRQTSEICRTYGVPTSSLLLTLQVSVDGNQLELPMGGSLNAALGSARLVSSGAVILITAIANQVLVAVAAAGGPAGWVLLAVVASISLFIGGGVLAAKITEIDFPGPVRKAVLSETKVAKLIDTTVPLLRDKLLTALSDDEMARIRSELSNQVSTFLLKRADEVKWIIS